MNVTDDDLNTWGFPTHDMNGKELSFFGRIVEHERLDKLGEVNIPLYERCRIALACIPECGFRDNMARLFGDLLTYQTRPEPPAPRLLGALVGCVEHMEHSTSQGAAAHAEALSAIAEAKPKPAGRLVEWIKDVRDFLYPIAHEETERGRQAECLGQAIPSLLDTQPSRAAGDVLAERRRQTEKEGWTPEHDDEHHDGSMAYAAACYALHTEPVGNVGDYLRFWPWDDEWWKPKDRRCNLVRAGALILAEIERIDRAAMSNEAKT